MHNARPRVALELARPDSGRLSELLQNALRRARRSGQAVLAAISLAPEVELDPAAAVCGSRQRGESWFVFEQPERDGFALAGIGEAVAITASGSGRFGAVAQRWRELCAQAVVEQAAADTGAPIAVAGFAFADCGGAAPHWRGFAPAALAVPELALLRRMRGGKRVTTLVLSALASPDDSAEQLCERLRARVVGLRDRSLPLLDPAPAGRFEVASALAPEHYEAAVARATETIAAGKLEKIVLAREVHVHAPQDHDAAAVLGVLRDQFPSCCTYAVGHGEDAFIGATPELLVRREGQRVSTLALAGSTRRSADPAVDAHLGEQLLRDVSRREEHAIVARRIERSLRPHAVWVAAAPEPTLVRIANIQHLATPIRAQLATPMDALALLGAMHPTPAVGGEPLAAAEPLIPALEGLDRGWYAGPVGWTDATGDGEFCVALRCALLRGHMARCFAGNGIVRGSDPAAELAETEIKLAALLPLLAG